MSEAGLGISMACHRGHLPFLPACLTSIRKWMPEVPLVIFTDGIRLEKSLIKKYKIQPYAREKIQNKWLREKSFGFGLTKMIGFWEAPFEKVFHLDVDTIMWGDVRENFPRGKWDVLHNEAHEVITSRIQKEQYFYADIISVILPEYKWENKPYFNTGVVCIRKNILDLDLYVKLLETQKANPGKLGPGEQGILNILVFWGKQMGVLKTASAHLQTVIPVCERKLLLKKYANKSAPTIFHWAGKKPWFLSPGHFPEPMHYFQSLAGNHLNPTPLLLYLKLIVQELKLFWIPEQVQKNKNRFRNLLKRVFVKK